MKQDKIIKFESFNNGRIIEIEQRWLWHQILIKEIHCDKCGDEDSITFHTKDIPKLIKILNNLNSRLYNPLKKKVKNKLKILQ